VENEEETLLMLRDPVTQSLFDGYYFERKQDDKDRNTTASYSTNYTEENLKRR
jgi:hypothetical protein